MRSVRSDYLLLLITSLTCAPAIASDESSLSFAIDNDALFRVDYDYTNGLFLSFATGRIAPDALLSPLSLSSNENTALDKFELVLGHKMYTPSDLDAAVPLANDRPYAGVLYGEVNYISLQAEHSHRYNLTLGTTGKHSLAEQAQNVVHDMTDFSQPRGWAYQIDDTFVANIGYLHHSNLWRDNTTTGIDWELSNISEVNAGNFRSDVSTGLMLRWGADLANNMGAANIDNENPFRASMLGESSEGWFVFTGIKVRYRFNDITIEGERSEVTRYAQLEGEDPSLYDVRLEPVQAFAVAGFAWYHQDFGITLTTTIKTPDYKHAPDNLYGTGALSLYVFF
ncbi:lipid A deacylase LpxR family protein [Vibrio sp. JPW-9-11-11]|uniref:lipid A deacylase LpxR family protein n=1 Tax=Vibrio sp. JPW-9-11-11 TaxID=1416532 RepID=UPI001592DDCF|nr:lipid A deacylase LpxR family protein [Vibrio sp. JPW-9-11-11]NVD06926.1 lipid A deacylase LpxR family protein [Vibrio sp. JPW-9-11-11]